MRGALPELAAALAGCGPGGTFVVSGGDASSSTSTVPAFDCETVAEAPLSTRIVDNARGKYGLVFDDAGRMIGSDGSSLVATDSGGGFEILTPGLGNVGPMARLADGDIVAMDAGRSALSRVSIDTGAASILAGDVAGYGVAVAPDGTVFAQIRWGDAAEIITFDPGTGVRSTFLAGPWRDGHAPRSLAFSPDGDLWFGTEDGPVFRVDLDTSPPDPERVTADVPGWHDCLGFDGCGNAFVCTFAGAALWRITPDGVASEYLAGLETPDFSYGHGVANGSGFGWRDDALYLSQPYAHQSVVEVVTGVPGPVPVR